MSAANWPSLSQRRKGLWVSLAGLVTLVCFAWLTGGGPTALPDDTRLVAKLGFLNVAVDTVSGGQPLSGLWLMVILGEPKVFGLCLLILAAFAATKRDWPLAIYVIAAPIIAEVITQYLAKPTFYDLFGGHYGYPSGHATAAITICIATYTTVHRLGGSKRSLQCLPLLAVVSIIGTVGVVVNGMHPTRDAIGAIFMSVSAMTACAAIAFGPLTHLVNRSRNADLQD